MPSDTRVSIVVVRWRAFRSAARWNGHAHHSATGAAQATSTHCQPGNRSDGTSDSIIDRSVSGMNSTSETISLRLRYAASAASDSPGWSSSPASGSRAGAVAV
jgi:hypothetical protein